MAAPVFKLPPPTSTKAKTEQATFRGYINDHPTMLPYANAIYRAARDYGIDSVYYASLLWKESFAVAKATGLDPSTIVSPSGKGVGIAQINPGAHVGEAVPWAPGKKITRAMLDNPAFSIQFGAYYFHQGVQKYGSYDQAYTRFYNPGYQGAVFEDVPKGYVPLTTAEPVKPPKLPQTPEQKAAGQAAVAAAKAKISVATWAVDRGGKVKFVTAHTPPKGTLKVFDQPLQKSDFLQEYSSLGDVYLQFTGRRPSFGEAARVISKGTSLYQLKTQLANSDRFIGSPVWRQSAASYADVWHQIYGHERKPDVQAIRGAIINNLGSTGFASELRARDDYTQSIEFKQQASSLTNVFRQIYGEPSEDDMPAIEQAAIHGYDQNMFASYLRSQPQYTSSPEYQSRALSFLEQLGMITGKRPTLTAGTAPANTAKPETLGTDVRLPTARPLTQPNELVATSG